LAQFHVIHDQTYSTVYRGLQAQAREDMTADQFHVFLKSKWKMDEHIFALDEWDLAIDGPLPDHAPNWDADELVPQPTPPQPLALLPMETFLRLPSMRLKDYQMNQIKNIKIKAKLKLKQNQVQFSADQLEQDVHQIDSKMISFLQQV